MFLSSAASLSANYVVDYDACSHVLNIHYPNRHLVALFIHNDYESELRHNKFATIVRDEYDPLDPANLRDPACSKWSHQDSVDYAFGTFVDRLIRAIRRIRIPDCIFISYKCQASDSMCERAKVRERINITS